MPILTLDTNVHQDKVPDDFLKKTAELVAEVLQKPVSLVVVHVHPNQFMYWAGTSEPCANATLGCIGNLGRSQNAKISKALSDHVKTTLGVNPDRMYIKFEDLEPENVGYKGTTFADL